MDAPITGFSVDHHYSLAATNPGLVGATGDAERPATSRQRALRASHDGHLPGRLLGVALLSRSSSSIRQHCTPLTPLDQRSLSAEKAGERALWKVWWESQMVAPGHGTCSASTSTSQQRAWINMLCPSIVRPRCCNSISQTWHIALAQHQDAEPVLGLEDTSPLHPLSPSNSQQAVGDAAHNL